jgi:predicted dinucleotide-binding enzyme
MTTNTTIGILGTGRMGVRLAVMFARLGHEVVLGSRDRSRSDRIAAEFPGVRAGSYADALSAPVVLPAAFIRDGLFTWLEDFRHQLEGKLYIDITNPFNDDYSEFITPWNTSGAEELQKRFPKTRVVGAFKNVWWEVFDEPLFDGTPSDVLVVSDHGEAKQQFLDLVEGSPFRYVDAGRLSNARTVERMTLLCGELGQRYEYFPRMNWRLLGKKWSAGSADRVAELIAR